MHQNTAGSYWGGHQSTEGCMARGSFHPSDLGVLVGRRLLMELDGHKLRPDGFGDGQQHRRGRALELEIGQLLDGSC